MDIQKESLMKYYKRSTTMSSDDEDLGNDFVQYGDYWEFRDPEGVDY